MIPTVENVLSVYNRATAQQIHDGMHWYDVAYEEARRISRGRSIKKAAGVIAALSPMIKWERNVFLAETTFKLKGLPIEGYCLPDNAIKATRIYNGEAPLDVLGGDKVRSFYQCIVNVNTAPVCIDRHAIDIAVGRVLTQKERPSMSKGRYIQWSGVYNEAAATLHLPVAKLQAVSWVVWRNEKNQK